MPERGVNDDLDNYSDEEDQFTRRINIQPMNLTEQELKARLLTLKDYSTWKNTKVRRILIRQLTDQQKSPIINAALSYGASNGINHVLLDYIKLSPHSHQFEEEKVNPFQKLLNEQPNKSNKPFRSDPSFINYKTTDTEKQKIYKMTNVSQQLLKTKRYRKQVAKTQINLLHITPHQSFPKELTNLKNKLKDLPSISKHIKTQKSDINPQEEGNSLGLTSHHYQESTLLKQGSNLLIDLPKREGKDKSVCRRMGRQAYLMVIKSILSKSDLLLDSYAKDEQEKLKVSLQSGTKSIILSQQKRVSQFNHRRYWPNYSRYEMSESDRARMQNLLKQFCQLNHEKSQMKEEALVMSRVIQKQLNWQQKQMDQELLEQEKNAFQHRFKNKINLERENYKRNVKGLVSCKKEYRIEKQRQEIRANGIKRNRKLEDITPNKTIELDIKQDDN